MQSCKTCVIVNSYVSCSTIVLYSRDHKIVDVSHGKNHPKIRDATIRINTILRIDLKNITIYCCIAIFGLGSLAMLMCLLV